MKKSLIIFLFLLILIPSLQASRIKASLSWCVFNSPADGPYVETYLSIWSKSIQFNKLENGKFQGRVGITLIFKNGNDVKGFKKYELKSPEIQDTMQLGFSFLDQQRILLPEGKYILDFELSDLNKGSASLKNSEELTISFPGNKINVSDIQLLEKFSKTQNQNILSKCGYDLVPYPDNFLPQSANKIGFYAEIYNADQVLGTDTKYLLSYFIQSSETGKMLNDFVKVRKETAKPVTSILHEFDIQKLPSGNFKLVIEVRNQNNERIAGNSFFFQRSNPEMQFDIKDISAIDVQSTFVASITRRDSLIEYIKCLDPISNKSEQLYARTSLEKMDVKMMQQYFLNFWLVRNPDRPENGWLAYKEVVNKVNSTYRSSIKKGYETDRGRIYLTYGPPNTIVDEAFPASTSGMVLSTRNDLDYGTVPYCIWHYYQLDNYQRDKKFVFANPHLATNDYLLVHSNVKGEVNNPNWQAELMRGVGTRDKDEVGPNDRYEFKSGDNYNNPH
ncbi:MAG: GWxTD domain-containing protein [Bacteroidota bacterium]